jgi:hypothetical protein
MSDEALKGRLSSGLGSVLGKVAQQVEPAAGHPRREVGLAQPAALSPPGVGLKQASSSSARIRPEQRFMESEG